MKQAFTYRVREVLGVHDGDTCTLLLDLGFQLHRVVSVRIVGIDTPEMAGSTKAAATVARTAAERWLTGAPRLMLVSAELDKYGRVLGDVINEATGASLTSCLLSLGLARVYTGGARVPWTAEECQAIVARFP